MKKRRFECSKCGAIPEEWSICKKTDPGHFACPRCNKQHIKVQFGDSSFMLPVDGEGEEQQVFVTATGRKIPGADNVLQFLNAAEEKRCRRCGEWKDSSWSYEKQKWDLSCPECGQKHIEGEKKLVPVDKQGNWLDVVIDEQGNRYIGEEEIELFLKRYGRNGLGSESSQSDLGGVSE